MTLRLRWAQASGSLLLPLALWAGAALGQPALDMTILPLFDGNVKEGDWFAVTTIVSNTGPRVRGSLEIVSEGAGSKTTFSTPVDVDRGSRKAYTLYVLNEGFSSTGRVPVLLAMFGRPPVELTAPIRSHPREDRIVALIGSRPSSPIALAGLRLPAAPPPKRPLDDTSGGYAGSFTMPAVGTVHLALHDTEQASVVGGAGLPTRVSGYDSIDVVVLEGFRPGRLSRQEAEALTKWVAAGGTLVVSAGGSAQPLQGSFVEKMLPVRVVGTATVASLGGVARRYGIPAPSPAPVLVTRAVQHAGAVLASQDGIPLIVEGRHDLGRVYFLAFDIGRQPARGWAEGMTELWRETLTAPPTTWRAAEGDWSIAGAPWGSMSPMPPGTGGPGAQTLADAVRWIPQMEVPSFGFVGAFLVLYVLFLVPINYFVLKALDKRELSWITTPLIVIVFSIGAYMIGRSVKGGNVLVTQAAVVQARSGSSTGLADDFIGIFSPSRTRYQVTMKDRHATVVEAVANPDSASPSRLSVLEQETLCVPALHVDMWAMKVLHSQGLVDLGKGIVAEALLTPDGTIDGQLTNRTPYALQRCAVVRAPWSAVIGDIASGDSASFSLNVHQLTGSPQGPQGSQLLIGGRQAAGQSDMHTNIRSETANALVGPGQQLLGRTPRGEFLVIGWIARARGGIIGLRPGSDDEADAAVLALRVPVRVTGSSFHIPAILTTPTIRDVAQAGNVNYGQDGAVHLGSGWFEADIHLPVSGPDIIADTVEVWVDRKGDSATLSVWDEAESRWRAAHRMKSGGGSIPVGSPQRVLRLPQGIVRVRVEKTGEGDEVQIRGLGVEVSGRRG